MDKLLQFSIYKIEPMGHRFMTSRNRIDDCMYWQLFDKGLKPTQYWKPEWEEVANKRQPEKDDHFCVE
uniref:Uncharacterized protein n=1 Tax=Romanomermis culicivorax TaxID=13658 RepID=A0A915HU66_ROMCU